MSKYVVKGVNSNDDVVISIVCPVDDLPNIIDTVNDNNLNVSSVRVTYLDPEYVKE